MESLKKVLPMEYLFWIKNFKKMLNAKQIESKFTKPKAYFLDTPEYGNLGDQAIAVAMHRFFEVKLPEYEIIDIQGDRVAHFLKSIKRNIKPNDIICLVGGGNMGTMYKMFEATRRIIIKTFYQNKIIIFPQTIDYEDSKYGVRELRNSRRIYESNQKLILTAREKVTFDRMKEYYPNNKVFLCPDIVLFLLSDFSCKQEDKRNGVGLCLRNDMETKLSSEDHKKIYEILESKNISIKQLSTISDRNHIKVNERKNIIEEKLNEFAKCELIITDRLHGMIFSAITGTPSIVFRSKNQKVEGVYRWIQNLPYIKLVDSVDKMPEAINEVLSIVNNSYNYSCQEYFNEIIEEIKR